MDTIKQQELVKNLIQHVPYTLKRSLDNKVSDIEMHHIITKHFVSRYHFSDITLLELKQALKTIQLLNLLES